MVEVDIVPSLDRFEAVLAQMPGIGAEQAKKLVKAVDKELAGVAKASKKHAEAAMAAQGDAFDAAKTKFEKTSIFAKELAGQFAPALQPVADVVEGIGSNFGDLIETLGKTGVALGAVGIAAGVTVAATFGLANAAVEAKARLESLGATMEADDAAAVEAYAAALKAAGTAADQLKVSAGGELASRLVLLNELMKEGQERSSGMDTRIGRLAAAIGTAGLSEAFIFANKQVGQFADETVTAANATREATEAAIGFVGPIKNWNDEVPKAAKATKSWEAALGDLIKVQTTGADLDGIMSADEINSWARATVEHRQALSDLADAGLRKVGAEAQAVKPQLDLLVQQWEAWTATAEADAAKVTSMQAFKDAVTEAGEAIAAAQAVTDPWGEALSNIFELTAMGAEEARARLDDIVAANAKANKALQRADTATARSRLEALAEFGEASQRAAMAEYQSKKEQALKAFQGEKAGKLLSIGMSTAAAIMQAYAQLGPIAGTAAGIGITIAGAAQAAIVAKTRPPTFHTGGMPAPDETDIRVKHGEPVLSQRDYGRLLDTLDRLDRRLGAPTGGMEASVLVQIDGRDLPSRTTVRTGRRNPYVGRG